MTTTENQIEQDLIAKLEALKYAALHARAVNLLSHGKYSLHEPREMVGDNKTLFKEILERFLERYGFALPVLVPQAAAPQQS